MNLSRLVDAVLDRTIAPGYGTPGLAIRRRLSDWPQDPPRMEGRTVVITGATGGIGLAAAQGFAGLGASVRLVGRSAEKGARAVAQVLAAHPDAEARFVPGDVSSLAGLEALCAALLAEERLDVLVNNAGVMPAARTLTEDGIDLAFATNVLGPFVLTDRLAGLLGSCRPSRIVNVSSGGMYGQRLDVAAMRVRGDDGTSEPEAYSPVAAYARTKRAEVVLTEQWAGHLDARGVVVHAMHPGWAATPGVTETPAMARFAKVTKPILRTAEQGADTIVWLGGASQVTRSTGQFWQDRRPRPTHLFGLNKETPEQRQRLWDTCVDLAGGLRSVKD